MPMTITRTVTMLMTAMMAMTTMTTITLDNT